MQQVQPANLHPRPLRLVLSSHPWNKQNAQNAWQLIYAIGHDSFFQHPKVLHISKGPFGYLNMRRWVGGRNEGCKQRYGGWMVGTLHLVYLVLKIHMMTRTATSTTLINHYCLNCCQRGIGASHTKKRIFLSPQIKKMRWDIFCVLSELFCLGMAGDRMLHPNQP